MKNSESLSKKQSIFWRMLLIFVIFGAWCYCCEPLTGLAAEESAEEDVGIFEPEVMEQVQQILSQLPNGQLDQQAVTQLEALGISAETINGITEMVQAHPGSIQELSAEELSEAARLLETSEQKQSVLFWGGLILILLCLLGVVHYLVRHSLRDKKKTAFSHRGRS